MQQTSIDTMIQEFWLDGMRPSQIAQQVGLNIGQVSGAISRFRNEAYNDNQATIAEKTAETLIRLRRLQQEMWAELDNEEAPVTFNQKLSTMKELRANEEFIARISGLVQIRAKVEIVGEIKLYDFTDDFPNMPAAEIVEAVDVKILETEEIENSDTASTIQVFPDGDSRREPDYDPNQSIVPLPDGSVIARTPNSKDMG